MSQWKGRTIAAGVSLLIFAGTSAATWGSWADVDWIIPVGLIVVVSALVGSAMWARRSAAQDPSPSSDRRILLRVAYSAAALSIFTMILMDAPVLAFAVAGAVVLTLQIFWYRAR